MWNPCVRAFNPHASSNCSDNLENEHDFIALYVDHHQEQWEWIEAPLVLRTGLHRHSIDSWVSSRMQVGWAKMSHLIMILSQRINPYLDYSRLPSVFVIFYGHCATFADYPNAGSNTLVQREYMHIHLRWWILSVSLSLCRISSFILLVIS